MEMADSSPECGGSESISRMIQIAHQFNVDNETQKVQLKDTIIR